MMGIPIFKRKKQEARVLWIVDAHREPEFLKLLNGMSKVVSAIPPVFSRDSHHHAILIAGAELANAFFNTEKTLDEWREQIQHVDTSIPVQVTFELRHLLTHPKDKRLAYQDLLQLKSALEKRDTHERAAHGTISHTS